LNRGFAAPALRVSQWLNSNRAITQDELRGKVVLVHAFQMLCPACVMQAGPQAVRFCSSRCCMARGAGLWIIG
jgi:hypothetical protein